MTVKIEPFSAVDEAERHKAFNAWRGKPAADIEAERDTVERDMERAFQQAGPQLELDKVDALGSGTLAEKCASLVGMHSQLAGLEDALRERRELDQVAQNIRAGNRGGGASEKPSPPPVMIQPSPPESLSDRFFAHLRQRGRPLDDVAKSGIAISMSLPGREVFNVLFESGAGWAPFVPRQPGYVPSAQREIQVTDVFPRSPTNQSAIQYMEETTFDNSAAEVAEGTASPEAQLALSERTEPIREIAVEIPVTRVQLEDEDQVRAYLDEQLLFMLRQRVDGQLMTGDGTAPNLSGVLDRADLLELEFTHDNATNRNLQKPFNTFKKAKTEVNLQGRAMPSHYIMHHSIWDDASLSESSAGGYYLGSPAEMFIERCWGLPVVKSDHLSADDTDGEIGALVGDFSNFSRLWVRRDFELEVGFSNDDFSKRQIRIQGTVRIALQVRRPAAFCTVTRPA